jgi:hypothetical protein
MSAIDLRHEHPANRSIPGFASTSLATRFVRPPAAGAASFTWVEHRLTATLQLRLSTSIRIATWTHARDLPLAWCANEIPLGPGGCRDRRPLRRYPPATVFSTASRGDDVASDAPVAPGDLRLGFRPADLHRAPSPLPPPPRQRQQLPRTRAPSIIECSLRLLAQTSRRARHRRTVLPPRSGFRRPFASPLCGLTHGETRPITIRWQARRRSTTSAINTVHEHDRSNRLSLERPSRAPSRAHPSGHAHSGAALEDDSFRHDRGSAETEPRPQRSAFVWFVDSSGSLVCPRALTLARAHPQPTNERSRRGVTGQGPGGFRSSRRLPSRLRATEASPRPDRLGHLLS